MLANQPTVNRSLLLLILHDCTQINQGVTNQSLDFTWKIRRCRLFRIPASGLLAGIASMGLDCCASWVGVWLVMRFLGLAFWLVHSLPDLGVWQILRFLGLWLLAGQWWSWLAQRFLGQGLSLVNRFLGLFCWYALPGCLGL